MNLFQEILYSDLMTLIENNEAFYFKDFEKDGAEFRIFNYRLASYGDFCLPNALECRGHMFLMKDGQPIRLASLPMSKFFNIYENPFTENLDLDTVTDIMVKEDGSLISTYYNHSSYSSNHSLHFKTKGSLTSDQVLAVEAYFQNVDEDGKLFYNELDILTCDGHTVNMEWTSPNNRIVLGYEREALVVLNVRDNDTGEYISKSTLETYGYQSIISHWVKSVLSGENIGTFVKEIPSMENIEGYVLRLSSGQHIKVKTDWYLVRHRTKDSINHPRNLFAAIISEAVDDIRSLFHNDPISIKIINDMVALVEPKYNHLIKTVETFYEANKTQTRKDYAIKAQGLQDGLMGLYMNLYIGRENDYKDFAIKNYKMFIGEVKEDIDEQDIN